ncbi:MAG: fibrillarin-like rRNA/tRNA 2'-O-methyltransferase, partial [Halobacteria archaeon]|nr:fibrillarin-like rRNA/tRNA 2'-O-methyltransferase [Halobacteria archaeon]
EEGGTLVLCVKARSEDVAAEPSDVYDDVADELAEEYDVSEIIDLEPFYEDHAAILATKK